MTHFLALELSIDAARSLREPLGRLRSSDPDLARQLRRAMASIALNLAEGRSRRGRDRRHHWRIASGSLEEVRAGLRVAEALGSLPPAALGEASVQLERLGRVVWGLTR